MGSKKIFNFTLYKRGMKESYKMLLIFAAVLTMYFSVIIYMFDPAFNDVLNQFAQTMPQLMSLFGMNPISTTLVGFISAYLYGFIMLLFPMLFSIISANRLIARHVDRGSMTYLLAAPVNRKTVVFTQIGVLITGIFGLIIFATILGLAISAMAFPNQLDIGRFLLLNFGALCLHLFIGGVCFACSCIFDDSRRSIGVGAGICIFQYVLQMLANTGDKLENIKYLTFFTLFNSDGIVMGELFSIVGLIVLLVCAVILFGVSIAIFNRKNLHI